MQTVLAYAASVLQDVAGIICMTVILSSFWQYRERHRACTAVCLLAGAAVSFAGTYWYLHSSGAFRGYLFACSMRLSYICLPMIILRTKKKPRNALLIFTLIYAAEMPQDLADLLDLLPMEPLRRFIVQDMWLAVTWLAVIGVILLFGRNRALHTVGSVVETVPPWLYFTLCVSVFTLAAKKMFFLFGTSPAMEKMFNVVFVFTALCIAVSAVYFVYKLFSLSFRQNQILKRFDDQHASYERMLKSDEELRRFRHDYKNHMMVVAALLNSGRTQEAADYLETVKVQSGVAGRQFSTGNFVADAILNNKNTLAEEFSAPITFAGAIPERGIENADLCTVMANLVDNAIDGAARYQGDRYVKVESNVRSGYMTLTVANPVNEKVEIRRNRIRTTKADAKNHGIGLKNVERTAEKYDGALLLSCDDTEFTADVNMKLKNERDWEVT